jgi:hypothetical protein
VRIDVSRWKTKKSKKPNESKIRKKHPEKEVPLQKVRIPIIDKRSLTLTAQLSASDHFRKVRSYPDGMDVFTS